MTLADYYLDYVNNFLTVEGFAEYYGLDADEAGGFLNVARELYGRQFVEVSSENR